MSKHGRDITQTSIINMIWREQKSMFPFLQMKILILPISSKKKSYALAKMNFAILRT